MLKKTITYTDLYDNEVTEDFYFNLTEAEIATLEISKNGGYAEYLQSIVNAQDGEEIANQLKSIVLKAYGKPSDDGKSLQEVVSTCTETTLLSTTEVSSF